MSHHYEGSCHCGAVRFAYDGEEITSAVRCTCSMCSRKGAMMCSEVIPPEAITVQAADEDLGLYQFDSKIAKHYFCKQCGIYTHNEMVRFPGHFRVNVGCIEGLDTSGLEVTVFDGKNLL